MQLQNQTPNQKLEFTQGDTTILALLAMDEDGNPVDLTAAVLTTQILGPNPDGPVSFPNSQHTIDPDQDANRGKFILTLTSDDTTACGEGDEKQILTTSVQDGATTTYRGNDILSVFVPVPVQ